MRVLLAATDYPPTRGGIQTLLHEFVTRTRHEVRVVAPADPGFEAVDAATGVPTRRVRGVAVAGSRRGFVPSLAAGTLREAAQWKPDVFFAGHVFTAPAGVLLRRLRRIPMVVGVYGVELIATRPKRIARLVMPHADQVYAVSGFTMDAARALGGRDGEVIPVGAPEPVDVDAATVEAFKRRLGLDGGRVLLTVSRLMPHKGVDVVVRALASLPPDVRYLVVGSGPSREHFERIAATSGVGDRVVFAGGVSDDDLAAAFRAADAFVLASRSLEGGTRGVEGCPVSLLEAGAYGLPIVAADTGGIRDAVEHGVTGLLVDPESPGDVTAALREALDGPRAKELAAAAAERARGERSWRAIVERIDALLERAATSPIRRR